VTVVEALALPPVPVHARVKVRVAVNPPVDWPVLLESALLPDQTPETGLLEAEQDVAPVDDQVSVELAPPAIV
jgi:hypothetical protein